MDHSPGRPRATDEYWFAVRSAENILWHNAQKRPGSNPAIEVRQKIWVKDDVYYSYNAAHPISPDSTGTRIGSVILCSYYNVDKRIERFGRQLVQYQISDILGDQLCYGVFDRFTLPEDAPISERGALINTMLSPDACAEVGMSLDTTAELYFLLSSTLQLGVRTISGAND